MNEMTREEKLMRFFEAQEHPEQFTDDELQDMLDDKDIHEDILLMRKIANTFANDETKAKTEAPHTTTKNTTPIILRFSLVKMAAVFVGCVLLAGVAYAAVHFVMEREVAPPIKTQTMGTAGAEGNPANVTIAEPVNTIADRDSTVTFDNEELSEVLTAMSAYYNIKVAFENEEAKHVRLFLVWDKAQPLTEIIQMLNNYERFNIELADNTLTVK